MRYHVGYDVRSPAGEVTGFSVCADIEPSGKHYNCGWVVGGRSDHDRVPDPAIKINVKDWGSCRHSGIADYLRDITAWIKERVPDGYTVTPDQPSLDKTPARLKQARTSTGSHPRSGHSR